MLYGFNRDHARILKGIARREGLAPLAGTKVKYPKPLVDDGAPIRIGKTTANITAPSTCTVTIYTGTPGSETSTGETVTAYTYVDLLSTKFCTVVSVNGNNYAGCYQT